MGGSPLRGIADDNQNFHLLNCKTQRGLRRLTATKRTAVYFHPPSPGRRGDVPPSGADGQRHVNQQRLDRCGSLLLHTYQPSCRTTIESQPSAADFRLTLNTAFAPQA
ncbi:MAG: hypothetical protein FRX48_00962 [Lasallia pustulata]|uniref:Uncharacterized protein n=1 Tax=Lasallia pustulata TaxID=136370 RepID=A0A5M8Q3I6_9LECA|nr:MAG: hypothetical protein FRX48_00962 [Lasallia pustulata]